MNIQIFETQILILIIFNFKMATIPKQHKAAVYAEPGKILIKIELVDTPEPGPGEVLVNMYALISMIHPHECADRDS